MKRFILGLTAAAGVVAAQPAAAADVVLLTPGCDLYAGCKFSGNDNPVGDFLSAYNTQQAPTPAPPLNLVRLAKLEAPAVSGTGGTATSATPFEYYVVKAGPEFWLYKLASPATSVAWSTANLTNKKGIARDISHLSFYNGAGGAVPGVPEPATWAVMIAGFGLAGAAMRRRRALVPA